jgi:hypothetical protein
MSGNAHVRFFEKKGGVIPLTYSTVTGGALVIMTALLLVQHLGLPVFMERGNRAVF